MTIAVYFQVGNSSSSISKASLAALQMAKQLKTVRSDSGNIVGLCFSELLAQQVQSFGVQEVKYVNAEELSALEAVSSVQALEAMLKSVPDLKVVVLAATSHGKDIAPRLSAKLECGQASDIVGVNADGTYVRPMFAGDVLASVRVETAVQVVTVRASAFAPVEAEAGSAVINQVVVDDFPAYAAKVVQPATGSTGRPDLGDADIVVSGGRALQSAENFEKYIFPLADALGGAVGASRAAVDAGYAPNDWQVGQTGKIVAPQLYFAIGISGAIQHVAGMKGSKTIVAINKDAEAPIFDVADYGLVMDLYEAVPQLIEQIKMDQ